MNFRLLPAKFRFFFLLFSIAFVLASCNRGGGASGSDIASAEKNADVAEKVPEVILKSQPMILAIFSLAKK